MDYQRQAQDYSYLAALFFPGAVDVGTTTDWTLAPDVGLAGQVWGNPKTGLDQKDLADYPKDPRHQVALNVGLHAGFAIPVCLSGNTPCPGVLLPFKKLMIPCFKCCRISAFKSDSLSGSIRNAG
ncbi:MAG: hypothetical protein R3B83_03765 [Nitrospirales bacterium]|nr:hypothetical protein [Nitrospirales bacterium]